MHKQYKVLFSDGAFEDLSVIPSKIGNNILDQIELLELFPKLGIELQALKWHGYRQLIIGYYRIIYKIIKSKNLIEIHFIIHGKMDF